MTRNPHPGSDAQGFSLLEMLVSMVVLSLFMGAAFQLGGSVRDFQRRVSIQADAQQAARLALARVVELLKSAGNDPSGDAVSGPEDAVGGRTATELTIQRDLPQDFDDDGDTWDVVDLDDDGLTDGNDENENGDGFLDDAGEDLVLTFDAQAGELRLTDLALDSTVVLVDRLVANPDNRPVFAYQLDASGDLVSISVEVTVVSDGIDPVTGETLAVTYAATVRPPMLGSRVLDSVQ